jgi:hypothetical protein
MGACVGARGRAAAATPPTPVACSPLLPASPHMLAAIYLRRASRPAAHHIRAGVRTSSSRGGRWAAAADGAGRDAATTAAWCGGARVRPVVPNQPSVDQHSVGRLPAFLPCSASVSMVLRGCVAAGRRGLTSSTAAAAPGASAVPAKLILGQPPRVWAMRAGHAAFVMLASMYLMTDMVLLRILGIVANGLDMFYCFLVAEAPLWLNIRWGAFYVLVNLVQLGQLYWEQRKVEMDAVQSEMFATHFLQHGMTQSQFVMLYRLGTVHEFSKLLTWIAALCEFYAL